MQVTICKEIKGRKCNWFSFGGTVFFLFCSQFLLVLFSKNVHNFWSAPVILWKLKICCDTWFPWFIKVSTCLLAAPSLFWKQKQTNKTKYIVTFSSHHCLPDRHHNNRQYLRSKNNLRINQGLIGRLIPGLWPTTLRAPLVLRLPRRQLFQCHLNPPSPVNKETRQLTRLKQTLSFILFYFFPFLLAQPGCDFSGFEENPCHSVVWQIIAPPPGAKQVFLRKPRPAAWCVMCWGSNAQWAPC